MSKHARGRRAQAVGALLFGLLGFALAVQVRANQESGLDGLRESDLIRILDDVSERTARLQAEARDLENTRDRLGSGVDSTRAALEEARRRAETLSILTGSVPATGPGIELTITDPRREVRSDRLLDTLQELRDAGAEALQIGGVRVVASTSFADTDTGVTVDGTPVAAPYQFLVIGDPRTLAAALDIPGGVREVLRQRDAQITVTERRKLVVSALRPVATPQYARPAPAATG